MKGWISRLFIFFWLWFAGCAPDIYLSEPNQPSCPVTNCDSLDKYPALYPGFDAEAYWISLNRKGRAQIEKTYRQDIGEAGFFRDYITRHEYIFYIMLPKMVSGFTTQEAYVYQSGERSPRRQRYLQIMHASRWSRAAIDCEKSGSGIRSLKTRQ